MSYIQTATRTAILEAEPTSAQPDNTIIENRNPYHYNNNLPPERDPWVLEAARNLTRIAQQNNNNAFDQPDPEFLRVANVLAQVPAPNVNHNPPLGINARDFKVAAHLAGIGQQNNNAHNQPVPRNGQDGGLRGAVPIIFAQRPVLNISLTGNDSTSLAIESLVCRMRTLLFSSRIRQSEPRTSCYVKGLSWKNSQKRI